MFKWFYWWKLSRRAKKNIKKQIEMCKKMGPASPPTPEQLEAFKKEWDLGWDSHMIEKVVHKRTHYKADLRTEYAD
jgi:hypothetical protein